MADLVITPANVKLGAGQHKIRKSIIVDNDVAAGELVAIDVSTADLADASGVPGKVTGMALNTADQGQPVDICEEGEVIIGAGTVAEAYFLSPNAGKVAPEADVINPNVKTFVGIGVTGGRIVLGPLASEQIVP
jgi:hypothetical protein